MIAGIVHRATSFLGVGSYSDAAEGKDTERSEEVGRDD